MCHLSRDYGGLGFYVYFVGPTFDRVRELDATFKIKILMNETYEKKESSPSLDNFTIKFNHFLWFFITS